MEPTPPRVTGGLATRAVHGATVPPVVQHPLSVPIHPSATWATDTSAEIGALLTDEAEGYVYGRYDGPTSTALHAVVASLHDAPAAWSAASGTAAIHAALDVLRGEGTVLATTRLYGGTWALLQRLQRDSGWKVDLADLLTADDVRQALTGDHTVVHVETIANPSTSIVDLPAIAAVCREAGVPLVVDNTFASPVLCRPLALGADVVVESATKFLGGHGDVVAGVLAGSEDVVRRVRHHVYELGASLGAFEAWLVIRGIQTLPLRVRQACANATAVAAVFAEHPLVSVVHHPSRPDHPQRPLVDPVLSGLPGSVLTVDLGSRDAAEAFADACEVLARAVSLGGTHSLIVHPASTTHRQLDDGSLAATGLTPGTVRLSIGIEDEDDLTADVRRALGAASDGVT